MTLYRHYLAKDKLALAFRRRRDALWTRAWLQEEVQRRSPTSGECLLAVFDVFDKWFRRSDFEGCSMLDLEITESVIMENVEAIIPKLQTIRGLGVEIAVDDFGTGYSSLAYIARLPIHDLKIDRSFIVGMTQSEDSLTSVKSVISLAHSLRLNVVAEGVETEEQAALLFELGCDQMQGYLISRPVPPDEVPVLLSRQRAAAIRPARRR